MRYGDVCSGISAPTMAWKAMGWQAAFFAEVEKFPSAVLAHHYPEIPNFGDMNRLKGWPDATIDLLVGGTPCQSFSVAGLRNGLDDPRGNLALVYLAVAKRYRPRWVVWENVPGVLSSNGGRDFGSFLGGLGELGYGWAYRILDAQWFGLAQRRKRVFAVGYLRDWRRAAAVLFEPEGMRGDSPPSREAGKEVTPTIAARTRGGGGLAGPIDVATAVNVHGGPHGRLDFESETFIAHSLRAEGFDASEDGTGRGTPLVPITFSSKDHGADAGPLSPTLRAMGHDGSHANAGGQVAIAFAQNQLGNVLTGDVMHSLGTNQNATGRNSPTVATPWAVRRLTPRECERLQGFPDDFTLVPYRGKPAADGPRYKALGNSMAVPVLAWIGRRIALADEVFNSLSEAA